jgi:4-hydroxy-2-oxoheptanedioate aldolase
MFPNPVKQKWRMREATVGGWIWIPNSFSAEVMAHQEYDLLVLDTQHGAMDFDAAFPTIQTITATGMPAFVRVGWNDPRLIMKYLDAGASGIIVPMVNSREEAERAVAACRYPPEGIRSAGPFRASISAGSNYQQEANSEIACVIMIETAEAVENLDEILSVPGIDCAYIGPGDLGVSMGFPQRYDPFEEPYRQTFVKVREAIEHRGIVPGLNTAGGPQAARFIQDGFKLITMTTDLGNMVAGARSALTSLKEALARGPS